VSAMGGLSVTQRKRGALHSRFNRKTSFIRSFIIIKEPGKLLLTLMPSSSSSPRENTGGKVGGQRKRKGENEREKKRALRYYFGSLIIFSSALLDLRPVGVCWAMKK